MHIVIFMLINEPSAFLIIYHQIRVVLVKSAFLQVNERTGQFENSVDDDLAFICCLCSEN